VLVANVHVIVAVEPTTVEVTVARSPPVTTSLLFVSRSVTFAGSVEVTALPVKVSFKVFKSAEPAEFAVNVMFARLSTEDFVRFGVVPRTVALGVSTVRRTVMALPVAVPDTVEAMFELAPKAVIDEVAAKPKVEVVLST